MILFVHMRYNNQFTHPRHKPVGTTNQLRSAIYRTNYAGSMRCETKAFFSYCSLQSDRSHGQADLCRIYFTIMGRLMNTRCCCCCCTHARLYFTLLALLSHTHIQHELKLLASPVRIVPASAIGTMYLLYTPPCHHLFTECSK